MAVPAIKQIIAVTAKQRDVWDESDEGTTWKTLKRAVASHQKHQRLIVASKEDEQEVTYTSNMIKLSPLQNF
jgi:hypothetical protein